MSTKRELERLRTAVIDAARHSPAHMRTHYLHDAVVELEQFERNLHGDAPAVAHDASIAAAKSLPAPGELRFAALTEIVLASQTGAIGITCEAIERRLKRSHQSVSSAVNFLRDRALITDGGRLKNQSGRMATAWKPTGAGADLVRGTT